MGFLLYLAIITIQFTNSLASWSIPMKCLFRDSDFSNSLKNITINPVNIDQSDWILQANNIMFQGMDDAVLDGFEIHFYPKVSQIIFHTNMFITFNYKTDGKLFSKPIEGEGFTEISLENVQIHMEMPFEIIEKDGDKYINLKDFDISFDIRDKAEYSFSNLYYGDKELSDTMHALMNENWKDFATDFGMPFFVEFGANLFEVFKNYTLDIPLTNFFSC